MTRRLRRAGGAFHRELRFVRQHAVDLAGAVEVLDAHDDVGDAAGDSIDAQRLTGEPAGARDLPALDVRVPVNTPCGGVSCVVPSGKRMRTARRESPIMGTFHITS